ncbi:ABC transporter substrate-binding protein [Amycolatopsis rubida]|uniref:NitT/TauT family transport system substrate-binding protein n=1 Tax=Amycolatopsis rubida TaxID=112413 RepID=A0A1I5ZHL8_9PSEU|nr:ABC transporter substrate-binding protein [Amycolatopsis rubida]SFQ55627.1 NitT/TauT family transport system substrate-binding protein [Amycolatopsis rubida]
MKKHTLHASSLAAAAMLALTACGSTGSDSVNSASAGAISSLSIGVFPGSVLSLPAYIGESEGLFAKHGLKVTLVKGKSGPEILGGLIGGSTQAAVNGGSTVIAALQQGQDLRTLPLYASLDFTVAATKSSGIKDVEGLIGKKVAVTARGGASEMFVDELLREKGLDPAKVTFVGAGPMANVIPLLRDGGADATVLGYTSQATFKNQGIDLTTLADPRDGSAGEIAHYGISALWATSGKEAARMSKVCAAFADIHRWMSDPANVNAGAKVLAGVTGIPAADAVQLWKDEGQHLWRTSVSEPEWKDNVAWVNKSTHNPSGKDVALNSACG